MKYSFRDVERLAEFVDRPGVAIPTLNDGCRAILQRLANRPDEWQAIDSLNVGTLLDVERLIVGMAVSFSRTETSEQRTASEGCQCRAKYLPDGSMAWIRPDGKPCDCEPTQPTEVVPIASVRITAIGAELLANIGKPAETDRLKKSAFSQRRHETPEEQQKRQLESEALRTQQIQRQTAELELQAVRLAAFKPTSADIAILTQISQAGGKIEAETILTNTARKQIVHELRELGFVSWYGDAGLLRGFEITRQGLAMLDSINKPAAASTDETLVSADQLATFAGVGGKVVRVALKKAGCKPLIESTGRGNPHQWRYCDAIQSLNAVKSGKLRSYIWPDTAAEVMPQKDSSKIPAKKTRR